MKHKKRKRTKDCWLFFFFFFVCLVWTFEISRRYSKTLRVKFIFYSYLFIPCPFDIPLFHTQHTQKRRTNKKKSSLLKKKKRPKIDFLVLSFFAFFLWKRFDFLYTKTNSNLKPQTHFVSIMAVLLGIYLPLGFFGFFFLLFCLAKLQKEKEEITNWIEHLLYELVLKYTIYDFQRWISRLVYRWRTLRNAIRNANCTTQWVIKSLNAYCAPTLTCRRMPGRVSLRHQAKIIPKPHIWGTRDIKEIFFSLVDLNVWESVVLCFLFLQKCKMTNRLFKLLHNYKMPLTYFVQKNKTFQPVEIFFSEKRLGIHWQIAFDSFYLFFINLG